MSVAARLGQRGFDVFGDEIDHRAGRRRVFVAECPALSGCVSQGKTREDAMANIRDAIQGYLHSLEKHGEPIPGPVTEEIIKVLV